MTRAHIQTSFARKPLDYVLSGPGAVRVLRALLAHGGYLSVSRLADDTLMTPMGVRKVLDDLTRNRLVHVTGSGRSRLYQAIAAHPLSVGLTQLFKTESDRFSGVVDAVKVIAQKPEISAAWLFGSVARYTDTPESDFDVAVVMKDFWFDMDADQIRTEMARAAEALGFQVSVTAMSQSDIVHHHDTESAFWTSIKADAIAIQGLPPEALVRVLKAGAA